MCQKSKFLKFHTLIFEAAQKVFRMTKKYKINAHLGAVCRPHSLGCESKKILTFGASLYMLKHPNLTCLHTLKIPRENEVNQVQRVLKDRKSMIANRDLAFQNEALNSDIANLGKTA